MTTSEIPGAAGRNFATFELGDDVYKLAGGLIPEIAERLDVPLGQEPNEAGLQAIMGKVGRNRVLRQNAEITAIDRATMADMVDRGGTQTALDRSLRTPKIIPGPKTVDTIVLQTCTVNWQDRAGDTVPTELQGKPVHSLGGIRVMDTVTEMVNPHVIAMREALGRYPTEWEYAGAVIVPKVAAAGFKVISHHDYPKEKGDELWELLFDNNRELLESRLLLVRNANAGVITAVQLRDAARKFNPDFDTDPQQPQVLIQTDTLPVSRTDEQEADSRNFQKTGPALRQLVLAALKQHLAAGGE